VSDWSVRGALPLYGVLEMTGDETHWRGLGRGLRTLLEQRVVQKRHDDDPAIYEAMSPYHRLHEDAPPFLVIQGGNDTLVDVNVARHFVEKFRLVACRASITWSCPSPSTPLTFRRVRAPRRRCARRSPSPSRWCDRFQS